MLDADLPRNKVPLLTAAGYLPFCIASSSGPSCTVCCRAKICYGTLIVRKPAHPASARVTFSDSCLGQRVASVFKILVM